MTIGATIRGLFGPYEGLVTDAYRSLYIDLDDWAEQLHEACPNASRILEIGCGEGASTERLLNVFSDANVTAIDITPRIGRLFAGDTSRVTFKQTHVSDIARSQPGSFDLVVMCDVLHHVPLTERMALIANIHQTIKLGGCFAFKDWAPSATPIHWMCYASDRYLTGDSVHFATPAEMKALLANVFGAAKVGNAASVRPWRNNISFLVRL
jgi:2-polyprenyl-3-methyl-5-hydroxy-6-metoxy-1,4-benzoquinol methylase